MARSIERRSYQVAERATPPGSRVRPWGVDAGVASALVLIGLGLRRGGRDLR
jgi:hypothetical protein